MKAVNAELNLFIIKATEQEVITETEKVSENKGPLGPTVWLKGHFTEFNT